MPIETETELCQVCSFRLEGLWFGLSVADILEIRELEALREVAGAPAYLRGLVNIRGEILTLLDLRPLLQLASARPSKASGTAPDPGKPLSSDFMVLLRHQDQRVCLHIDEVGEVLDLPSEQLEALPASAGPRLSLFGHAFWSHFPGGLVLLDVPALFSPGLDQLEP